MDLLFKRYASPFLLLDSLISARRFSGFVDEFITWINKDNEDKVRWDIYLHKVFNQSYQEFIESMEENSQEYDNTPINLETALNNAENILNRFKPPEEGE